MDAELKRRVEALRRPLELAAADGFAGVRTVRGLGHALRAACDGVLARIAADQRATAIAGLDTWRATLGRWEQLDEQQQAIEVARGMRLLARLPRPAVPPPPPAPTFTLPPLPAPPESNDAGSAQGADRAGARVPRAPGRENGVTGAPTRRDAVATNASLSPSRREAVATSGPPPPRRDAVATNASLSPSRREAVATSGSPSPRREAAATSGSTPSRREAVATSGSTPAPRRDAVATSAASAPGAQGGEAKAARPAVARKRDAARGDAGGTGDAGEAARRGPGGASREHPAAEPVDPLAAPTHSLPGIGPAFAEKLAEKGLTTVEDLVWLVPRRYDDVRDAKPLAEVVGMPEGQRVTFSARVASARMVFARGRRWAEVRLGSVERSETGGGDPDGFAGGAGGRAPRGIDITAPATALVRWFNVFAGIDKRMPPGSRVTLSGVVRARGGRLELANPDILAIELETTDEGPDAARRAPPAILARYPDVAGVPPGRLRAACAAACARVASCAEDGVPPVVEAAAGLPGLAETLAQLHAPPADTPADDLAALNRGDSRWQRRLAFGELFALGVAITLRRRERRADAAVPCPRDPGLARALAAALPFALTGAQRRAIDEIAGDLAQDAPMNRLLQGDVGAGKTAVAFAAALQIARAGRQTAVMAPTELLAEQHAETWRGWAKTCRLRLELLTASTPKGVRASILALAAAGELDVVIGTHALLAEAVGFAGLGLVVIDEQHRFGVAQRAKLRDKGDGQGAPHLLVMTATPIPRTLALTAYGDLDTSVLDELPPGRTPVTTRLVAGARGTAAAYKLIAERVHAGERAYIVYPKVAPDDDPDGDDSRSWKDATTGAAEVAAALPGVRVGLVHGRLDGTARDRVMRAFKAGEIDALVATTVIEVGVDVPAATVMVIHDADRFGLAQLHQLRGRVGRGSGAAHCLLVSHGSLSEDARRRLDAMAATHDGFRIAEEDLALRGPGELFGPKQAGVPRLRFGDLQQHTELLLEARRHAEAVLEADPDLAQPAHAALRRALARRMARSVYGAESG